MAIFVLTTTTTRPIVHAHGVFSTYCSIHCLDQVDHFKLRFGIIILLEKMDHFALFPKFHLNHFKLRFGIITCTLLEKMDHFVLFPKFHSKVCIFLVP